MRREAASLVPRQIGRARADLQYRLAEAARRVARTVQARFDEGTSRLERALADAAALRSSTTADVTARDEELAGRLEAVEHVFALLDRAVGAGADTPAAGAHQD